MSRVWEDDARYDKWLQIEVAVCEAWAEEGVIARVRDGSNSPRHLRPGDIR